MRVEIDIDLNNIDYAAINEQIKKKLDETDLDRIYRINSICEDYTKDEVKRRVDSYLSDGYTYPGLSNSMKYDIKTEVSSIIHETVKKKMDQSFSKMGDEEFGKMIADMIPAILVDVMYDLIRCRITELNYNSRSSIMNEVEHKIKIATGK